MLRLPPIPPSIEPEYHAWYRALIVGAYLLIVAHAIIVLGWWYAGVMEMVYYIVSFALLGGAAVLARQGRLLGGLILATIEIFLHAILGTFYAGWESGLHIPIIAMAIAWSAHPGRGNAHRRYIGLEIIAVYIAFLVVARTRTPMYTFPDWYLTVSSAIMISCILIALLLLVVLQGVSAGWYMSLQEEREKSEHLLLNVLPATIAARWNWHGQCSPHSGTTPLRTEPKSGRESVSAGSADRNGTPIQKHFIPACDVLVTSLVTTGHIHCTRHRRIPVPR